MERQIKRGANEKDDRRERLAADPGYFIIHLRN